MTKLFLLQTLNPTIFVGNYNEPICRTYGIYTLPVLPLLFLMYAARHTLIPCKKVLYLFSFTYASISVSRTLNLKK